jgi:hypothetical protein
LPIGSILATLDTTKSTYSIKDLSEAEKETLDGFLLAYPFYSVENDLESPEKLKKASLLSVNRENLFRSVFGKKTSVEQQVEVEEPSLNEIQSSLVEGVIQEELELVKPNAPLFTLDSEELVEEIEEQVDASVETIPQGHSFYSWLGEFKKHSHAASEFGEKEEEDIVKLDISKPIEAYIESHAPKLDPSDPLERLYAESAVQLKDYSQDYLEEDNPGLKTSKSEIIDSFLAKQPSIRPALHQDENYQSIENKARPSGELNAEVYTETLALIFEKQKHFNRAIEVYKQLLLKMPEKNRYFATRIAELKNKIK